jgi:hypothetical protein
MRRVAPAVALFFIAPYVAEFLLGNLPITLLGALVVLGPLYGGGALLVREVARRRGFGWGAILTLGLAYAVVEEALALQTLFNPDFLKLNLHLLAPAYIPVLGMGGAWTMFVLTLHVVWSIGVSIALTEALFPARRTTPWLGRIGLTVTALLYLVGLAANAAITLNQDPFMASPWQLTGAALVVVVILSAAFLVRTDLRVRTGSSPSPWVVGALTLVAGSLFLLTPMPWGWGAVAAYLAIEGITAFALVTWSRSAGWTPAHVLGAAGGAALAYGWHAFPQPPVVPASRAVDLAGNAIFLALLIVLLVVAGRENRLAAAEKELVFVDRDHRAG